MPSESAAESTWWVSWPALGLSRARSPRTVETPGKGSVLATKDGGNTRQRQCLTSRDGLVPDLVVQRLHARGVERGVACRTIARGLQESNVCWLQRIRTSTTAIHKPTAQTERSSPVNSSNAMTPTAHQSTSLPATTEGVECHAARRICFATALRNEPLGTGMQGRKRRGETAEGTGKEFDLP